MNAINVARHKHFRVKKFRRQKKWMEKSRFGKISTEEIQEIMDSVVPVTTKELQSLRIDYLAVRISLYVKF